MNLLNRHIIQYFKRPSKNLFSNSKLYISNFKQYQLKTFQISNFKSIYRFSEQKDQNKKDNDPKEEEIIEKKDQKLPDEFEKLIELDDPKAIFKAKQMYSDLEKKNIQLKDENSSLQKQFSGKNKNFEELSKTASQLRQNLKIQIEEVELTRKRLQKEKEEAKTFSISKFAKEILEVQDNLQRALDSSKKEYEGQSNQLYEGTQLTYRILEAVLQRNGIVQDNPLNQKFDANKHEALFEMEHETIVEGNVAYVATVGYQIGDRVLRPAKVGVVKQKKQEVEQEQEQEPDNENIEQEESQENKDKQK